MTSFNEITPSAKVMSELCVLLPRSQSRNNFDRSNFISKNSLPLIVKRSPQIKKLLAPHVINIGIDQTVAFVVLVDNVECFPVPKSKEESGTVFTVVAEDSVQSA